MEVTCEFNIDAKTAKGLEKLPSYVVYRIAVNVLEQSYPIIPKDTHKMARLTRTYGVRGEDGDFYLESPTTYASHVWNLNDSQTNWTTPDTHSQWFARTVKEHGQSIIKEAVDTAWKENM